MRRHFPGWIAAGIAIAVWGVTFASKSVYARAYPEFGIISGEENE